MAEVSETGIRITGDPPGVTELRREKELLQDTEAEEARLGVVVLQEAQSATAIAVIAAVDLL